MERVLSLAVIGIALIGGYVITSGTNATQAVAQSSESGGVTLAKVTPLQQATPTPSRPVAHASYVENCTKDGKAARAANPKFKFKPDDTVEALCACLLDTMVSEGVTEREVGIIGEENLVFAQAYSMSDPQKAMNKIMASEKRMNEKLGKDRYKAIQRKSMKAMRCPGLMPVNLKEVMGR